MKMNRMEEKSQGKLSDIARLENPPEKTFPHLRSEKFKQAVIDAISDQIVVIGADGRIVEANAAWNSLSGTPLAAMGDVTECVSYFDLCQVSSNLHAVEMRNLAEGVHSVLNGKSKTFRTEYIRAHPKTGKQWFSVNVTPLAGGGAVLVHKDITERKNLESEIISISEYERRQMGKDLHDGLCQVLGGMMLSTAVIAASLERQNLAEANEISRLVDVCRNATMQARELARSLHPVEFDAEGLAAALQELVSRANTHISCTLRLENPTALSDSNVALTLYRIAQEALGNALRHANAIKIEVSLGIRRNQLILNIEDDGRGLAENSDKLFPPFSTGIQIMKYRASSIGARLQIKSPKGSGTKVSCVLPLPLGGF